MGNDRTWVLGVCPECGSVSAGGGRNGRVLAHCTHQAEDYSGPYKVPREPVSVVEGSRLREAEAERDQATALLRVHKGTSERLAADLEERQAAIDRACSALHSSAYVGGQTEREAWRAVLDALGPFETQHQGMDPDRARGVLEKGDTG